MRASPRHAVSYFDLRLRRAGEARRRGGHAVISSRPPLNFQHKYILVARAGAWSEGKGIVVPAAVLPPKLPAMERAPALELFPLDKCV